MFSPETLDRLGDFKIARIVLPTKGDGALPLECVVRVTSPPFLEATFLPNQLPREQLDAAGPCLLACDIGMSVLSVQARIDQVIDGRRLRLKPEQSSAHEDTRRHFRVQAEVQLRYWPTGNDQLEETVTETVNLSGSGIRFHSSRPFLLGQKLKLEITLPGEARHQVSCAGKVVSLSGGPDAPREVALEISEISPAHLGRVLEFCLAEKLREMGGKARFLGSVLSPDPPGPPEEP
ncbi:hypothetical protein DESUT3_36630 [Desulfuromonas versatilis]|uniref:PilZ domain-containing protein n=1 Tax=Desulfuromonas versatilis TaxID=2802975 RepID=A0ABM8HX49_9BACT|nr:PilZ domain-containing protein [Desulfuromonas versatilis]BCR06594.1 hypothetical protein DESUT3_36630 [Desulfuromonas versatilis]